MFTLTVWLNFPKFCDTAPLILIQTVIKAILSFLIQKSVYIVILRGCMDYKVWNIPPQVLLDCFEDNMGSFCLSIAEFPCMPYLRI